MAKRLKDAGLPYDCFEMSDNIGGNWYFNNPNGTSSCYQSLHIDTSKWRLAFEDYPVPREWPDFPHHAQLLQYFNDYVDHFDLRETITFNTAVTNCEPLPGGRWAVTLSTGETREYDALVVANGHHWDARTPTYPGTFDGYQVHSHHYRDPFTPYDFRGKTVMVVGAGNSAMDISSELVPAADRRQAVHLDAPRRVGAAEVHRRQAGRQGVAAAMDADQGRPSARPQEDHQDDRPHGGLRPAQARPPTARCPSLGVGRVPHPGRLWRHHCRRVASSGSTATAWCSPTGRGEQVDAIVWATGYNVTFPFLAIDDLTPKDNTFPLYKRMVKPGYETLFFLGLAQPLPTLVNFAEQQSKLVARGDRRRYVFPDASTMAEVTIADEQEHLGHFYDSPRHRMQVDFNTYVADLAKEVVPAGTGSESGPA